MEQNKPVSSTSISLIWNWVIKEKKNIQFILIYAIVSGLLSLALDYKLQYQLSGIQYLHFLGWLSRS